jgi:hypothetical protein
MNRELARFIELKDSPSGVATSINANEPNLPIPLNSCAASGFAEDSTELCPCAVELVGFVKSADPPPPPTGLTCARLAPRVDLGRLCSKYYLPPFRGADEQGEALVVF